MKHIPIRLGPLALLLTVISICMTTLGILAFATARADYSLAEKYAATVRDRYVLEKEGQAFLREVADALADGLKPEELDGTEIDGDGLVHKVLEGENSRLRIAIIPEGDHDFRLAEWRIQKDWEPDGGMFDLWDGE